MTDEGTSTLASAEDQQTAAAYVTFTMVPEGPALSVGVPEEHSVRLLEPITAVSGVTGSLV